LTESHFIKYVTRYLLYNFCCTRLFCFVILYYTQGGPHPIVTGLSASVLISIVAGFSYLASDIAFFTSLQFLASLMLLASPLLLVSLPLRVSRGRSRVYCCCCCSCYFPWSMLLPASLLHTHTSAFGGISLACSMLAIA
jgi:hypothetical protein